MRYFHDATDAAWLDTCTFHKNELLLRLYPERRRLPSWLVNLGGPADVGAIRAFFAAKAVHKRVWDISERQRAARSGRRHHAELSGYSSPGGRGQGDLVGSDVESRQPASSQAIGKERPKS